MIGVYPSINITHSIEAFFFKSSTNQFKIN